MNLDTILTTPNLAESLDESTLNLVGRTVYDHYKTDLDSRSDWVDKYISWLDMAGQKPEKKTKPWKGAANIKYPMLTNACLQFNARVVPALMPNNEPVGAAPFGPDPTGEKRMVSTAIAGHMNYQLTSEMNEWEDESDSLMMSLSLSGIEYKKTYYDPIKRRNVSRHVTPLRLVVNYWADELATVRKTEIFYWNKNRLLEKINGGSYLPVDWDEIGDPTTNKQTEGEVENKERVGLEEPSTTDSATPYLVLEYHGWWDFDDDGYEEPYIITILEQTQQVLSIVPRFSEDEVQYKDDESKTVKAITPLESYTKYSFIPNPDGSFYDIGFGHLLYHINAVVNTATNQLLDNGTLNNTPGGFFGRGIKMRRGEFQMSAGKWYTVNSSGDDLKKNIVQMPVTPPSPVLLSLVEFMVDSGQRLSATTEEMTGKHPGQNTKTGVTQAVMEQGQKVFTAIYKRIRRSLKEELDKLYKLNGIVLESGIETRVQESAQVWGLEAKHYNKQIYNIQPSSDPNIAIKEQQLQKDMTVVQLLQGSQMGNVTEAVRRLFSTMEVENVDQLLPEDAKPKADPKEQEASGKLQLEAQKEQFDQLMESAQFEFDKKYKAEQLKVELLKTSLAHEQKGMEIGAKIAEIDSRLIEADENAKNRNSKQGGVQ